MLRFKLRLLHGEGTYKTKLDVKTFPFSSSNWGTQRCNRWKSRQSKLLSFAFVPNQRLPYKLVDRQILALTGLQQEKNWLQRIFSARLTKKVGIKVFYLLDCCCGNVIAGISIKFAWDAETKYYRKYLLNK